MTDLLHDYSIAIAAQEMAYAIHKGLYGQGKRRRRSAPVHREPEIPEEVRAAIDEYKEAIQ